MWTRAPPLSTEKEFNEPLTAELLARSIQYKILLVASNVNQDGLVAHSVVLWDATRLAFFPVPTSRESVVTFPPESAAKSVMALQEPINKVSCARTVGENIRCMIISRKKGRVIRRRRTRSGSACDYIRVNT